MKQLSIKEFIEQAHKELSLIENMHGEVIYSSCETFKKGKYIMYALRRVKRFLFMCMRLLK